MRSRSKRNVTGMSWQKCLRSRLRGQRSKLQSPRYRHEGLREPLDYSRGALALRGAMQQGRFTQECRDISSEPNAVAECLGKPRRARPKRPITALYFWERAMAITG